MNASHLGVDEDVDDQSHEKIYPFLPSVRKLTDKFEPLKADDDTLLEKVSNVQYQLYIVALNVPMKI